MATATRRDAACPWWQGTLPTLDVSPRRPGPSLPLAGPGSELASSRRHSSVGTVSVASKGDERVSFSKPKSGNEVEFVEVRPHRLPRDRLSVRFFCPITAKTYRNRTSTGLDRTASLSRMAVRISSLGAVEGLLFRDVPFQRLLGIEALCVVVLKVAVFNESSSANRSRLGTSRRRL